VKRVQEELRQVSGYTTVTLMHDIRMSAQSPCDRGVKRVLNLDVLAFGDSETSDAVVVIHGQRATLADEEQACS
jgi:hypothetical protein